jgi:Protein of Unknown function (DUF2784)
MRPLAVMPAIPALHGDLPYQVLADAVLVLHAAIVVFVVVGLVFIVVGNLRHWRWANAPWFRLAHLGAIAVVVAQAWLGVTCPLTTLEMWLRAKAGAATYSGGFVEHWLQRMLYYDAPAWVFALGYSLFGLFVLATWWYFPPASKHRHHEGND